VVTAAATRAGVLYLGRYATVMDVEAGIMLAWECGASVVTLDSQSAIARTAQLDYTRARSWIEERLQKAATGRTLMRVKGHLGVSGNKTADKMARKTGWTA